MREIIKNFFSGMIMGAVELVPGFSGGTMAFMLGIYYKLLDAIRVFDLDLLRMLGKGQFKQAMARIPWSFLLPLLLGMVLAIFGFANIVLYIMGRWSSQVWSFFMGLILAAIYMVLRQINLKNVWTWLWLGAGIVFCVLLDNVGGLNLGHSLPVMFISGFLAICALIMPGISGSFVLVLLGQYEYVLSAVVNFDLPVMIVFVLGIGAGLLSFARVVTWLLRHFYSQSMAGLTGLMAGCLLFIWPWQTDGKLTAPPAYDMSFVLCLLFMALGLILPLLVQHLTKARAGGREQSAVSHQG